MSDEIGSSTTEYVSDADGTTTATLALEGAGTGDGTVDRDGRRRR